jgi:polyisoprenoid-binding protein YceI
MRQPVPAVFVLAAALAVALALAPPAPAAAAVTYTVDDNHSEVSFRIRHFVSKVRGQFRDFSATIVKDDADPMASSVEFTIQAASIDTDHETRDADLRSPNFFDVEKFPAITFKSTAIAKSGDDLYDVTGELTMHGVTKTLTLPVSFGGEMADGRGGFRAAFETATTLDRKEFGLTWNRALDQGGLMLGDEIEVVVSLAAIRK